MKQYLKMSGYFIGCVTINADGQICDDKHFRGSTDIAEDYYHPICQAINSHDELVQINQELLAALEAVASCGRGSSGRIILDDFDEQCLVKAISKAKGGAA